MDWPMNEKTVFLIFETGYLTMVRLGYIWMVRFGWIVSSRMPGSFVSTL